MFTLFSIPKGFEESHTNIIQKNAIQSWKRIHPDVQIILVGDDPGVREVAEEYGVQHIPHVKTNDFGTPMLDSAFSLARQKAVHDVLVYSNADIIITSDFTNIFTFLPKGPYLAVGRRWDLDVTTLLDYSTSSWEHDLKMKVQKEASLHGPYGSDYFIFQKNAFVDIPAFAVGRPGWDNWMIGEARRQGMYTIDCSNLYKVIHQNHDYRHIGGRKHEKTNPEAKKNRKLAPGDLYGLEQTNYQMTSKGLRKKHFDMIYILKWIKYRLKKLFAKTNSTI